MASRRGDWNMSCRRFAARSANKPSTNPKTCWRRQPLKSLLVQLSACLRQPFSNFDGLCPSRACKSQVMTEICSCRSTGFRCNLALHRRSPNHQVVCHPPCTGWQLHRLLSSESSRESIARACRSVQRQDCRSGLYCLGCLRIDVRACREPVPWLSRSVNLRATTKRDKAKRFSAQLVRASPLQGEGRGFESLSAHLFMSDGEIVEVGTPGEIFDHPKEPRTQKFLSQIL